MTQLFKEHATLRRLNADALHSPLLHIVNQDAFQWLQHTQEMFDVIVVDFPDPTNFAIGKLYTQSFYALLEQRLAASGYAVVQTTSPLVARRSFWTVVHTIESIGLHTTPYHAHVPSFGEWGFIIASRRPWRMPDTLPPGLRWLILTENRIEALPAAIGRCSRLQKLALAGNRLASLPPEMAACTGLELLRLAANRLTALPDWLPTLPRLAWLAYAGNPFCAAVDAAWQAEGRSHPFAWDALELGEVLGQIHAAGSTVRDFEVVEIDLEHVFVERMQRGEPTR
jgi:hypothetical protein